MEKKKLSDKTLFEVAQELISAYSPSVLQMCGTLRPDKHFEMCKLCATNAVEHMIKRNEISKKATHVPSEVKTFLFVDTQELMQIKNLINLTTFKNFKYVTNEV